MKTFLIVSLVLIKLTLYAQSPTPKDPAERLTLIYESDQKVRESSDWKMILKQDSLNQAEVTKILDQYGWLGVEQVGVKGNAALFLVIQHAELPIQEKYLPLMREAVTNKKAAMKDLALLEDRVLMRHNKKQIYGSQIVRHKDGNWIVHPIEDPTNVDKRRAEIGLEPIAKYVSRFGLEWNMDETYPLTERR